MDGALKWISWEDFYALAISASGLNWESSRPLGNLDPNQVTGGLHLAFRTIILMIPGLTEDENYEKYIRGLKTKVQGEVRVEILEPLKNQYSSPNRMMLSSSRQ
jgi:hypothetical protein